MFCPKCVAQIQDSSVFCPQCGNNLTPTVSLQPDLVVAPPPLPVLGAPQPPAGTPQRPRMEDLASLGQRFGSYLIAFWVIIAASIVVAVLVAVLAVTLLSEIGSKGGFEPGILTSPPAGNSTTYKPGVGVQYPIDDASHVPEGRTVIYSTIPPTSGQHWPRWADCGFYPEGLPDERIVHNLEHSNIVVSYNLTPAEASQLRQTVDDVDLSRAWGVTRYYDKPEPGSVSLAAWGVLDTMRGVDRSRIKRFFEAYAGRLGPEIDEQGIGIPCNLSPSL
ncbi:MAG: DUF3105 domain-containing protein [Dehalococcoidia bacterium]|nr:DUF3105 domain-containing protein [Dehalococcoidia bacterium]MSQ16439.1 DUF3105 domain-containing protein [Dehalococcoidia bacterium]